MTTMPMQPTAGGRIGRLSVLSVSSAAALAAYTHSYDFGPVAFLAGAIVIAMLLVSGLVYERHRRRALLLPYALLNLWIIVGFGMVGGFWDHVVKGIVCVLHGGAVPPSLEPWFTSPGLGSAAYEIAWVLTFLTAVAAAVTGWRFIHARAADPVRPA